MKVTQAETQYEIQGNGSPEVEKEIERRIQRRDLQGDHPTRILSFQQLGGNVMDQRSGDGRFSG